MAENKGYIGKIGNSGVQVVKAPVAKQESRPKGKILRGNDLRNKGGK